MDWVWYHDDMIWMEKNGYFISLDFRRRKYYEERGLWAGGYCNPAIDLTYQHYHDRRRPAASIILLYLSRNLHPPTERYVLFSGD